MSTWIYDLHETAQRLGLKKTGSEYKGPCPVCGGNDRFWLSRGRSHPILATCRHDCSFGDIMREMENVGLATKDPFERPAFRRDDLDLADWLLRLARFEVSRGGEFSEEDRSAMARLTTRVDQGRKMELFAVLEQMRASK